MPARSNCTAAAAQAGRIVAGQPGNLQVADHHRDRAAVDQRPVGHQVVVLQLRQRRGDDAAGVRVAGAVAVAGEMLEHRQQAGVAQTPRVGPGVLGDLRRVVSRTSGRRSPCRRGRR